MEKRCYRCKELKPISDFSINKTKKDGHNGECNECHRQRLKKEYREICQYIGDYKLSRGCAICGYNKCASALEFHHNGDKEFQISDGRRNIKDKKEEMKKCIVLCANCHRELHNGEI